MLCREGDIRKEETKLGKVLGLDIRTASVGWSLIDIEDKRIIDMGVRKFDSADASNNQIGEGTRSNGKDLKKRRRRLKLIENLLNKHEFGLNANLGQNPYELRVKALAEQLSKEELRIALYHLAKKRGIFYLDKIEEADKDIEESLKRNRELLKTRHPCQIQLERFNNCKYTGRAAETKGKVLINVFDTGACKKEAIAILKNQSKYHKEIDERFIRAYINILTGKGSHYTGFGKDNPEFCTFETERKFKPVSQNTSIEYENFYIGGKEKLTEALNLSRDYKSLLAGKGVEKNISNKFQGHKFISLGFLNNENFSPTIKIAINRGIKIINDILKRHRKLEAIVIKMPGEANTEDEKDEIKEIQFDLLTFEEDIEKYEAGQKFINRNLVDTGYVSKAVLNGFQKFMSYRGIDTQIHVVRGKITSQIKKEWDITRDGDEFFEHHGVDATIVAVSYMLGQGGKQ